MNRRDSGPGMLLRDEGEGLVRSTSGAGGVDLDAATIPGLQRLLAEGELTAAGLLRLYLDRIARLDPLLNAVVGLSEDAERDAERSDARRRTGGSLGLMDGIPLLVKDNIDVAGMPTTVGSRAMTSNRPALDAVLVRRLRAAGAVVIGKSNLSEWENFRSWKCTSGWSGVGGQTRNPHVLDRSPCGSSGGSAAGTAAALAQVSVGSETDGSLICPAGINGVVGFKPSLGLISRTGMMTVSADQDTAGPMARHVVDAAVMLSAMSGRDASDSATAEVPWQAQPACFSSSLVRNVLCGRRVALWRLAGCVPAVDAMVAEAVATLTDLGAKVVEVDVDVHEFGEHKFPALLAEFRRDLGRFLAGRTGEGPSSIEELVEFNRNDGVELSLFGQELLERALDAPPADGVGPRAQRARAVDLARLALDEAFSTSGADLMMAPTNSPAWVIDHEKGDQLSLTSASAAAVAGYPSISVPAGFDGPRPLGISFTGRRWADADVLAAAYAFEGATQARRPPEYLLTHP